MVETMRILKEHGVKEIYAGVTHAILANAAVERLKNSDATEVVVTNTVPIPEEKRFDKLKVLSIAPLFAEAIKRLNEGTPLGDLFDL